MAKIREAKDNTHSSGSYSRIFNNDIIGNLITKIQSTSIRNGNELEKIITTKTTAKIINTTSDIVKLVECLKHDQLPQGIYLCLKKVLHKSKYSLQGHEPDLIIIEITEKLKNCYIIELKDGDTFDTKKSDGEYDALVSFKQHLRKNLANTTLTNFFICAFNQTDKRLIVNGFKGRFGIEEVMTGQELCDILGIDYYQVINERKNDANDNVEYFVDELTKIPVITATIRKKKLSHISDDDFYVNTPNEIADRNSN